MLLAGFVSIQEYFLKHCYFSPYATAMMLSLCAVFGPVTAIGDIHGVDTLNYTKDEKITRGKLASCYRLADINGWSHGLDGSITVCLTFLCLPYNLYCVGRDVKHCSLTHSLDLSPSCLSAYSALMQRRSCVTVRDELHFLVGLFAPC